MYFSWLWVRGWFLQFGEHGGRTLSGDNFSLLERVSRRIFDTLNTWKFSGSSQQIGEGLRMFENSVCRGWWEGVMSV